MSGGVDSSTATALLKERGYDVVGVFILMHENGNPKDARRVAQKLKIPFKILNVKREFKKKVIDYLVREYKKGNTPNPCIECNKHIKFKFLFQEMNKLKADFIATGHYARNKNGKLLIARDKQKDQSYFLWQLNQKQIAKIIFPIGDYTKEEIRQMAKKFKLPVFEKKDSQEICFIDTCIEDFLRKYIKPQKGPIITTEGRKIGEHEGLEFYTIGQRKGIKVGGIGPFYVVQKDFKNNALIVSNSQKDLLQKEMIVKKINWISGKLFSGKCRVKIRSMAQIVSCRIFKIQNSKFKIKFLKPQRAITSGQSAVLYKNNQILGGGIIC